MKRILWAISHFTLGHMVFRIQHTRQARKLRPAPDTLYYAHVGSTIWYAYVGSNPEPSTIQDTLKALCASDQERQQ